MRTKLGNFVVRLARNISIKPRGVEAADDSRRGERRLNIEPLEDRLVLSSLIRFFPTIGLVRIEGTPLDDRVIVRQLNLSTIEVYYVGYAKQTFAIADVSRIDFFGREGNDEFRNNTGIYSRAFGHEGDDILIGGWGDDLLDGGPGNDTLDGREGNDRLYGGPGHDILYGGPGNDRLWGGPGNDQLFGGTGDDMLYGEDGHDILYGGKDNDRLFGGNGNDRLYGGAGADYLDGGAGNDSLFGGGGRVLVNRLIGGPGRDRFLLQAKDNVLDLEAGDARLIFKDGSAQWTNTEIEILDNGLHKLHMRVNNTRLLKDTLTSAPLTFVKASSLPGGADGENRLTIKTTQIWNPNTNSWTTQTTYIRSIHLVGWNTNNAHRNEQMASAIIHEIGHNWDSRLQLQAVSPGLESLWSSFRSKSSWISSPPSNPTLYTKSLDGKWWYRSTAQFAEYHGRSNPNEDWSTIWELYFQVGGPTGFNGHSNLKAKLLVVDELFTRLAS